MTQVKKARRATNREFFVVRYLPDDLAPLLYQYLVYIRRFCDMLHRTCLGLDMDTPLMFPSTANPHEPRKTEELTKLLKSCTESTTGVALGSPRTVLRPLDWHQLQDSRVAEIPIPDVWIESNAAIEKVLTNYEERLRDPCLRVCSIYFDYVFCIISSEMTAQPRTHTKSSSAGLSKSPKCTRSSTACTDCANNSACHPRLILVVGGCVISRANKLCSWTRV